MKNELKKHELFFQAILDQIRQDSLSRSESDKLEQDLLDKDCVDRIRLICESADVNFNTFMLEINENLYGRFI